MFYHVKELQFNARVSGPDPRFARLLLEQFGGGNGELKAAMQYFVQAFGCRQSYPDKYDLLMDIATEEFSHLEIVGATITMLLDGLNGDLKNASEKHDWMSIMKGSAAKEQIIHESLSNPYFMVNSGGGPAVTDSNGIPWNGYYVNANGDLTVDLRSNIGAESRAKIVYEYLMQFTDDPEVKDTLGFLMTREITHFQMFNAALADIQPNFPPGILQGDPRFINKVFNMSNGADARGPWNQGSGPWGGDAEWVYINNPRQHVVDTDGLKNEPIENLHQSPDELKSLEQALGRSRSEEIKSKMPKGANQWSSYPQDSLMSPKGVEK